MNVYGKGIALICIHAAALVFLSGCLSGSSDSGKSVVNPPPPAGNSAPTISGTPGSSIKVSEQYSFTPAATDANDDPLSFSVQGEPGWLDINSTTGNLSGTPLLEHVGTYSGIIVSVSDGSLSASLPQFTVDVVQTADGSITLSWTAPTQNEDGSALMDLTAYKFYYGTSPGSHPNEVRVDSPGITTYVLENLTPATYYIIATAINSNEVESGISNEASKQVL